jgi:hypothetical protein
VHAAYPRAAAAVIARIQPALLTGTLTLGERGVAVRCQQCNAVPLHSSAVYNHYDFVLLACILHVKHMTVLLTLHSAAVVDCCRYGGVVERPNIAAQADWYIYDIHALLDALQ